MVALLSDSLEDLKPASKPAPIKAPSPPPVQEKWSRENHPAFKKAAPPVEEKEQEIQPTSYNVNDNVMAKWVSGDKGFYPARITAVTGSATARMYTVKFKSYDTVETLRIKDIRPIAQKRKADGTAVVNSPAATTPTTATYTPSAATPAMTATSSSSGNGVVLSAPATLYPEAQQVNKDGTEKHADDPAKPKAKKIKATKELEAGKSKWQEFNSKSKFAKAHKKDSMFRTPEGIHGRGMSKSQLPPPPFLSVTDY